MSFSRWRKLSGDTATEPLSLSVAKSMLGALDRERAVSGVPTVRRRRVLADGTLIEVGFDGDVPHIRVTASERPGRPNEEVLYAYISNDQGLLIFDMGTKELLTTLTGLQSFEVDHVTPGGFRAFMTGAGLLVDVDLNELTAFGFAYTVDTTSSSSPTGRALLNGMTVNPDGTRALASFHFVIDADTGAVIEGLGGSVLLDTKDFSLLRPAIRMEFRPHAAAWAPDSQRFFLATTLANDPGDVSSIDVANSRDEFIAIFDRDGTLQSTTSVATWPFDPGTGFARRITSIAVGSDFVFVAVANQFPDIDAVIQVRSLDSLALVAEIPIEDLPRLLVAANNGLLLAYMDDNSIAEINQDFVIVRRTSGFSASALWAEPSLPNTRANRLIQSGPDSRIGNPPDTRQFFLQKSGSTAFLHGYSQFDTAPVYELDMSGLNVQRRYAIANVGVR